MRGVEPDQIRVLHGHVAPGPGTYRSGGPVEVDAVEHEGGRVMAAVVEHRDSAAGGNGQGKVIPTSLFA